MKSKEALEKLLEMAIENGLWKSGLVEDLENTIKQDLEVLEWLKEHIDICISDFNWNSLRDFIRILVLEYADGKKVNDWSISDVKSSLNGDGFLNKEGVFTTAEKNVIAESNVATHELRMHRFCIMVHCKI